MMFLLNYALLGSDQLRPTAYDTENKDLQLRIGKKQGDDSVEFRQDISMKITAKNNRCPK